MWGKTVALAGVAARFEAGTVTVVSGSNGSGKSTLLRVLAGLSRPTRGEVRYETARGAYPPSSPSVRRAMGFVGHEPMVYPELSGLENLEFFAGLYGLAGVPEHTLGQAKTLGIAPMLSRPARALSRGQLQRLCVLRALLHQPQMLLLDEPASGLDASGMRALCDLIADQPANRIVVVVTHNAELIHHLDAHRLSAGNLVLARGRVQETPS